jgi:hypothetical protein
MSQLRWVRPSTTLPGLKSFAAPPAAVPDHPFARMVQVTGLPEVPPPFNATPADQAAFLLQVAAEVEHGLLVQYLYAAYSADTAGDAFDPVTKKGGWYAKLKDIAVQEMDHLLNVQNMLLALKRRPYFNRANFPPAPDKVAFYPFPFQFEKLTEQSLGKYVTAESMAEILGTLDLSKLSNDEKTWLDRAVQSGKSGAGEKINHVGVIYGMLYWMFQPDDTPVGPWLLPPDPFVKAKVPHLSSADFAEGAALDARQGSADEFVGQAGPEPPPPPPPAQDTRLHRIVWSVKTPADARAAIAQIAEQGEGVQIADDSHFLEFLSLFGEYVSKADAGGAVPVLPLPTNPNTKTDPTTAAGRITLTGAAAWAKLFNARYRILLTELALALSESAGENTVGAGGAGGPPGLAARDQLVPRAINKEMEGQFGIKSLAQRLIKMPLKADGSGMAAPPFEMPDGDLPDDPAGHRDLLVKLLADAATAVDGILALTGADAPSATDQLHLKQLKTADAAYSADVALMQFTP